MPNTMSFRLMTARNLYSTGRSPLGLKLGVTTFVQPNEDPTASMRFRWSVRLLMYEYRLLDINERELLTYHWMPGELYFGPNHPHVHVSAALNAQVDALTRREIGLDKLHLVTGQVSLAAFVRMLIADFDVAPQRQDWRAVLDRAEPSLGK